jgi:Domain of unknown function DUF29
MTDKDKLAHPPPRQQESDTGTLPFNVPTLSRDAEYNTDFVAWATEQAVLLRSGRLAEADIANIAEEIEGLARSDRRELASRIRTVLEHLMKLQVSPAQEPRAGWQETIDRSRLDIELLLRDSPSLRREVPGVVAEQTTGARRLVQLSMERHREQPTADLEAMTFGVRDVLGE